MILDVNRLTTAIDIRDRSYHLFLWLSQAINRHQVLSTRTVCHSADREGAVEWFKSYYDVLPDTLRPPKPELHEFAAFFSTFLISSFDVNERPGTKGAGAAICPCELCARIVNAPNLQAKKLYARDKRRANVLMIEHIDRLAEDNQVQLADGRSQQIVEDPNLRRDAAYVTYGEWLIKRLSGESDGPAILALWRLIAWDPRGGMRPGFKLKLEDFVAAEAELIRAIKT